MGVAGWRTVLHSSGGEGVFTTKPKQIHNEQRFSEVFGRIGYPIPTREREIGSNTFSFIVSSYLVTQCS